MLSRYFFLFSIASGVLFDIEFAVGVSHNPESITEVGCIEATSWNNKRLCGVPFHFHFVKHLVESHGNVTINVLENTPSGVFSFNNLIHVRPDVSRIFFASSFPRN
jgi:glucose-6-phosphate 1-dehydrogenase